MGDITITRRSLLLASAVSATGGASGFIAPSRAKGLPLKSQVPFWYRFAVGQFECTVVSDGTLPLGDPAAPFPDAPRDQLLGLLERRFLPRDRWDADENVLVVNTGDQLVMFDSGIGGSPGGAGRLIENLRASGIVPEQIDALVISHAHPDHIGGLLNEHGAANFSNASIYMAESDYVFWTDEANASAPSASPLVQAFVASARKNLLPLRERISFFEDGKEFLPGILAMSAPGHTVGHTIFAISSNGKTLINCADLAHHPLLMLKHPFWKLAVDTDAHAAVQSRLKYLGMLADERTRFIAYHFPFPGVGHVTRNGDGFEFIASALTASF